MNESNTSNVGQVTGLFIGSYEPTNKNLIWYDNTPNQMCHKVYDYKTKSWVALNPVIVAPTTYSEIVNNAKKNGLPIGKHYQITDKSNVLAVSISKTKIWYVDTLGNILIDDLGTNIQYHVSSSNLLIDDINGVFDTKTNKLIFQFTESDPDYDNDYVLGKKKSGTSWFLSKFKISSFLSKNSDNAISWNSGFFFNFKNAISNILNKAGGIVGYDKYNEEVTKLNTAIGNVSKENQNIVKNASDSITNETTANKIYEKAIPKNIDISVAPTDVLLGDTLFNILSKFQRWINRFKYADGIFLSRSFADAKNKQYINNNDTVNSAFQKIQYFLKNPTTVGTLPSNWNTEATVRDPSKETSGYGAYEYDGFPVPGDTIFYAFAKIVDYMKGGGKYVALSEGWKEIDYSSSVPFPKATNSIDYAVTLIVAKLKQLGIIEYGILRDNVTHGNRTNFNVNSGSLNLNQKAILDNYGIVFKKKAGDTASEFTGLEVSENHFRFKSDYVTQRKNGFYSAAIIESTENDNSVSCALQAVASGTGANTFDAFFSRLKCGSITYNKVYVESPTYQITRQASLIIWNGKEEGNMYLPNKPEDGLMILILQGTSLAFNVHAQGTDHIDAIGKGVTSVRISDRGSVFSFIYVSNIKYGTDQAGLWECMRWDNADFKSTTTSE